VDCAHPIFSFESSLLFSLFFFFSFFFLALLRGVVGWLKDFSQIFSLYIPLVYINLTLAVRAPINLSPPRRAARLISLSLSLSLSPSEDSFTRK
jgi:hypothetical protein